MSNPSVRALATALVEAPALPGGTRIGLIDGPAGSGKTTLAARLAEALGGTPSRGAGQYDPEAPTPPTAPVQTIHGDDLYEGWGGLPDLDRVLVDQILSPLSRGERGAFRMWDWHRSERTHEILVPVRPFVLVEGVGVARRRARQIASMVLWVEAPRDIRFRRGIARDGEAMRADWIRWMEAEERHFAADRTRAAADMVLDGTEPFGE